MTFKKEKKTEGYEKRAQLVLAGDIGGTKTWLGLFGLTGNGLRLKREKKYLSQNYPRLEKILKDFLEDGPQIAAACFGVAGPVTGRIIRPTNLPWRIDTRTLGREFSIPNVEVINDLVANAHGISMLTKGDFVILNHGKTKTGNAALLSPGTGLGEAILFWDGKDHLPSASEGGHVEFGPRNPLEVGLLQYLCRRFGHVSYERILSGAGLFHLYRFLRDSRKYPPEPRWLSERLLREDPARVISEVARSRRNRLCVASLDLFVSIYGAAAGNLALHAMALRGVYLGGGIAPKMIWKLREKRFMEAFKDKGRFSGMLAEIPVKVIMNERTALLGAARCALKRTDRRET